MNNKFQTVIDVIKELNAYIVNDDSLGDGFQIGHSYFCSVCSMTNETMEMIIEYEIVPLLTEYWFDEKEKVTQWTNRLRGALND